MKDGGWFSFKECWAFIILVLLFCLQVWGKPLWSRKPVKLWCCQEPLLKVFTQRRWGRAAGESALMLSPSPESGATCPESGADHPIPISLSASFHHGVLTRFILPRRDGAGVSHHGRREYTVGQYVVDLPSFESLALPLFRNVRYLTIHQTFDCSLIWRNNWKLHSTVTFLVSVEPSGCRRAWLILRVKWRQHV